MLPPKQIQACCLALVTIMSSASGAELDGADDFNDNVRDAAKWANTDETLAGAAAGTLTETSGRLQYSAGGSPVAYSSVRVWKLNRASYTNNWFAQVDVNVANQAFAFEGQEAEMGLGVRNVGDTGDRMDIGLDAYQDVASVYRAFYSTMVVSGVDQIAADLASQTASTLATLRLRWDAASQTMFAEYDANGPTGGYSWTPLGSRNLATGFNWGMSSSSTFEVGVYGYSAGYALTGSSGVFADNFLAVSAPAIASHPTSQTVVTGGSVNLSTTTGGSLPQAFQWRKGAASISGATNSTLSLTNVQAAAAAGYSVVVSNAAGSVTSAVATLTVLTPPVVSSVKSGQNLLLSWPTNYPAFVLQYNISAVATNWTNVVVSPIISSGNYTISEGTTGSTKFFRLRQN